jgi:glycosyltransferase involved in cell wall biosynthesis
VFSGLTVGVVIPAYNEERFIARTLRQIPRFVDEIIVIDDSSRDRTFHEAVSAADSRTRIVRHETNQGVGGAIVTGYREAVSRNLDVAVVMAGDGQMDPADLEALLLPIARGEADYVKGNRFLHPDLWSSMPKVRLLGSLGLSMLTRISSGYPGIWDSQCGYTAVTRQALAGIDLESVYRRYGFPNDFLAHLHSAGCRLAQVCVRPVYEGQDSGIRPARVVLPLSLLLARSLALRLRREWRTERSPSTIPSASR